MKSIMKDNLKVSKPKKISIDDSKGVMFNLNKFIRFIEKNNDVKPTKENISYYLMKMYGMPIEEFSEDNLIKFKKHFGEQPTVTQVLENMAEDMDSITKNSESRIMTQVLRKDGVTGNPEDNIYLAINLGNTLPPAKNGGMFQRRGVRYKYQVLNAQSIIALGLIVESMEDTWNKNKTKVTDKLKKHYETKDNVTRKTRESLEDIDTKYLSLFNHHLINNRPFTKKYRTAYEVSPIEGTLIRLIYNHLEFAYSQHLNYVQMVEYTKERKSEYATAFKTKKNITKKVEEEMKQSPFLKTFKYVELDNDTDLNKYKKVYEEYSKIMNNIAKIPKKAELRFRKLGQHRASGIYFPHTNCIAVDLRDVSSFLHEYAHAIDFNQGNGMPISLDEDFYKIISHYKNNYSRLAGSDEYLNRKSMYFTAPTEIFARGFELAMVMKGYKTFLVSDSKQMNTVPYKAFKGVEKEVENYFSKFIK